MTHAKSAKFTIYRVTYRYLTNCFAIGVIKMIMKVAIMMITTRTVECSNDDDDDDTMMMTL